MIVRRAIAHTRAFSVHACVPGLPLDSGNTNPKKLDQNGIEQGQRDLEVRLRPGTLGETPDNVKSRTEANIDRAPSSNPLNKSSNAWPVSCLELGTSGLPSFGSCCCSVTTALDSTCNSWPLCPA